VRDSAFESSSTRRNSPRNRRRSMITAAATTGPASGPRPASSMPHTTPSQRRSIAKSGIGLLPRAAFATRPPPRQGAVGDLDKRKGPKQEHVSLTRLDSSYILGL